MSAYPLGQCLYCGATLDDKTKYEHIIPSALGGSLKTKKVLYSACNEKLGKVVDDALGARFRPILNYLGPGLRPTIKAPEIRARADGKDTPFGPGFVPYLGKSKIEERDGRGRPTKAKARNKKTAQKLARTAGMSEPAIYEEVMYDLDCIDPLDTNVYDPVLVCACAKITLEYGDYVSQTADATSNPDRFRQPAFDEIVTLISQFNEIRPFLVKDQVPRDKVPPFLSFDKAYCFPRFKYDMERIFKANDCPDDSPFRHRILVCGNNQKQEVVGIVDFFRGDIWACPLSTSYNGDDFTYLYHRSIIRDTEPDWSSTIHSSLTSLSELEAIRPPSKVFTGHPCTERYVEIYGLAMEFIESEYPVVIEKEMEFLIRSGFLSVQEALFGRLERRLHQLFGRNDAWSKEWPQIESDALTRFQEQCQLSSHHEILELSVALYQELFKRCKQHIGSVIPMKILGYPPIDKS